MTGTKKARTMLLAGGMAGNFRTEPVVSIVSSPTGRFKSYLTTNTPEIDGGPTDA